MDSSAASSPERVLRLVIDGPDIGRTVLVPPDVSEVRVYADHYDVLVYFDGAQDASSASEIPLQRD